MGYGGIRLAERCAGGATAPDPEVQECKNGVELEGTPVEAPAMEATAEVVAAEGLVPNVIDESRLQDAEYIATLDLVAASKTGKV